MAVASKLISGCVLFAICLLGSSQPISAGKNELEAPLLYRNKRVRYTPDKKPTKKSSTRWVPISQSKKHERPLKISTNRKACGFYVWNAVSASMYHLCRYLMRDSVFEGKGGRKFVRIEPGSLLELLYPASRHSPDKCLFCGGSYADHMTLWWSKHIYSPYDLYMDRTYADGVLQKVKVTSQSTKDHRATALNEPTKRYAFHTRYVLDLGLLFQGITRPRDKIRKLEDKISEDPYLLDPCEMRRQRDIVYVVPSFAPKGNGTGSSIVSPLLRFARQRVLQTVDALIGIQDMDNELLESQSTTR